MIFGGKSQNCRLVPTSKGRIGHTICYVYVAVLCRITWPFSVLLKSLMRPWPSMWQSRYKMPAGVSFVSLPLRVKMAAA